MDDPSVSFVVIGYNERERAPACIRSILDQTSDVSFEILFVDDGSTDGTQDTVSNVAPRDGRLQVIRSAENRGRGAARAAGVAAAHAPLIAFVDADIVLPPDWLARCLTALPGAAAVSGIAIPDGDVAPIARMSQARPRLRAGSMPITGNNLLIDRAVLQKVGFDPRDRLGEDFRLAHRLGRAGYQLRRVEGLVVRHLEAKSYSKFVRWRFQNGLDAAGHLRLLGRLRLADGVWIGWIGAWVAGATMAIAADPIWLWLGPLAGLGSALFQVTSRFQLSPPRLFIAALLLDILPMHAYLLGRTIGVPKLFTGRSLSGRGAV